MNFEPFINSVEKAAANSIKAEEGDYIMDGLLFCGKCKTKKQTRIEIFGSVRTPYCLCKCESEKMKREQEERERRQFEQKVKTLRSTGFPESEMAHWTFASDDLSNDRITKAMQNYVEHFSELRKDGKGLLLFGKVGTGKTFAAACVANALIDRGIPCLVTNFARIANTAQGLFEGRQEYFDSLNRFPLLVLDDLSAERKTEWMQEIVYNVIDSRYRAKLPLIVTTNLTAEELKHPSDISYQRTFSRLLEMCLPVEVTGKDRRKAKLIDYNEGMKNMLEL